MSDRKYKHQSRIIQSYNSDSNKSYSSSYISSQEEGEITQNQNNNHSKIENENSKHKTSKDNHHKYSKSRTNDVTQDKRKRSRSNRDQERKINSHQHKNQEITNYNDKEKHSHKHHKSHHHNDSKSKRSPHNHHHHSHHHKHQHSKNRHSSISKRQEEEKQIKQLQTSKNNDTKIVKKDKNYFMDNDDNNQEIGFDMYQIDEEEQLKKEREAREERMREIKKKYDAEKLKEQMNNIEQEMKTSDSINLNSQQNGFSNIENNQISENQIICENTQIENTKGKTSIIDEIENAEIIKQSNLQNSEEESKMDQEKVEQDQNNQTINQQKQQDNNNFYKILDQQRSNWYDQQIIREQEKENEEPIQQQQEAQILKVPKRYDMFGSESDQENEDLLQNDMKLANAIQKGYKVNTSSVDSEGYYLPRVGEMINERYKTLCVAGKGVFSCVVKAVDTFKDPQIEIAIKIIRKTDITRQSGEKEKQIVSLLNQQDPHDKKHIIRLYDSFDYKNHLCLVFECMDMNLRETLQKHGKKIGLSLDAVILYGRQLFCALHLLHKNKLIHSDLKPDNIMVSKDAQKIKLGDFGSCLKNDEIQITKYIVSRYYRAPEIILGALFNQSIDIWSAGVSLFELYTQRIMFPGRSNNEMLKYIMQTKGKFKNKLLKRSQYVNEHFNPQNFNIFLSQEENPLNKGQFYVKQIPMPSQPSKPILFQLKQAHDSEKEDYKSIQLFADFLEKCLVIDPQKRITAEDALKHPFLNILEERKAQQQGKK